MGVPVDMERGVVLLVEAAVKEVVSLRLIVSCGTLIIP